MPPINEFILAASGLVSTVYGFGEKYCGDIGKPVACEYGAITASGEIFDPSLPSAAIAAPSNLPLKPTTVRLRVKGGKCHAIRITDKMHPRWIGLRGFDLTPASVQLLMDGQLPSPTWSAIVEVCK